MTDEAFWTAIEEEVMPFVVKETKLEKYWRERIHKTKQSDLINNYDYACHEWMTFGCMLRVYYQKHGLDIKRLIEFCCLKVGKEAEHIKFE